MQNTKLHKSSKTAVAERILVVDDVYDNCFLLQIILETEGYKVDIANDGLTALVKVETDPPDLILLDVMMPGMNGYEVTQRIKQNDYLSSIPIVLVTAHETSNLNQELLAKTNGIIRKPIEHKKVLARVQNILNSQSLSS